MPKMKQVCLYCGCHLGTVDAPPEDPVPISHGVCALCLPTLLSKLGQPLTDFLDTLPGAILVVDSDCRVVGANTLGLQQISKELSAINGQLAGQAFECKNSKLQGGCGGTIHCKTCTIRITVTKTAETGENCHCVPAFIDLAEVSKDRTIRFLISTEKVRDAVLLRIEDVRPGCQDDM
jgi:stage V sporulation protein SpoVS